MHLNAWSLSPPVLSLAERLIATLPPPLERAMFLSTGGEANEAAVRMAKFVRQVRGRRAHAQLARRDRRRRPRSRSPPAGAATARRMPGAFALPAPYEYRCPIRHCDGDCDCTCLEAGFELFDQASRGRARRRRRRAGPVGRRRDRPAARLLHAPGRAVRGARDAPVLDECQTGLGRLGSMYGFEVYDVVPDFLVLSKTLGGGVPIGAVVTTPEIEERASSAASCT